MSSSLLQVPSSFASWRQILQFASSSSLTGRLAASFPDETVYVFVVAGKPIIIGSSHPEVFIAPVRSLFDLDDVPAQLRATASYSQKQSGLPLYVYLEAAGLLTDRRTLLAILRRAGSETLARLDAVPAYLARFDEVEVPGFAREFACDYELTALFIESYRRLAEANLPEEALVCGHQESADTLANKLTSEEKRLLQSLSGGPILLSRMSQGERIAAYVLTRVDLATLRPVDAPEELIEVGVTLSGKGTTLHH